MWVVKILQGSQNSISKKFCRNIFNKNTKRNIFYNVFLGNHANQQPNQCGDTLDFSWVKNWIITCLDTSDSDLGLQNLNKRKFKVTARSSRGIKKSRLSEWSTTQGKMRRQKICHVKIHFKNYFFSFRKFSSLKNNKKFINSF